MDPISGALVAGMFGAALEKASEAAVNHLTDDAIDAGQGALGRLVAWVRRKFSGTKELERVEDAPDSPSRVKALGDAIENQLASNQGDRDEISALVAEVNKQSSSVNVVGDHNIVTAGSNSPVSVRIGNRSPVSFGSSSPTPRPERHARD
ncbi:MAG: hypothetical protein QM705_00855 [Ancrocorticia sp.]